jgi:hypothetical protein
MSERMNPSAESGGISGKMKKEAGKAAPSDGIVGLKPSAPPAVC